jgi:hypothetical protein
MELPDMVKPRRRIIIGRSSVSFIICIPLLMFLDSRFGAEDGQIRAFIHLTGEIMIPTIIVVAAYVYATRNRLNGRQFNLLGLTPYGQLWLVTIFYMIFFLLGLFFGFSLLSDRSKYIGIDSEAHYYYGILYLMILIFCSYVSVNLLLLWRSALTGDAASRQPEPQSPREIGTGQ